MSCGISSRDTWSRSRTICFPVSNNPLPCVGLILDDEISRALKDVLLRAGFRVVIEPLNRFATSRAGTAPVDAWVFDARSELLLDSLLDTDKFLLPADNPPHPRDSQRFATWSAGLLNQLDSAIGRKSASGGKTDISPGWEQVQAVWLLAGSAGAPAAIQEFLNCFRTPPPVGFILAQHYSEQQRDQLKHLSAENPIFTIDVGEKIHSLRPGHIVLVPPHCKVSIEEFGVVSSSRSGWNDRYTPNIDELVVILAAAKLPAKGIIFFSGMGADGAAALPVLDSAGARIWAQAPQSAVCDSMPRAAIATGLVHRTGRPAELAAALQSIYG